MQELITEKQSWIERLVEVLVNPHQAFARIHAENSERLTGLGGACIVAVAVLLMDGIRSAPEKTAAAINWSASASLVLGLSYWLCLSGLLAIVAMCFGANKQAIRGAIVSVGWSFTPWMFMGPLFCYHYSVGSFFTVLAMLPAVWVFALQYFAIMQNFALKWWQAALLVFVAPCLLGAIRILELVQTIYLCASSMSGR